MDDPLKYKIMNNFHIALKLPTESSRTSLDKYVFLYQPKNLFYSSPKNISIIQFMQNPQNHPRNQIKLPTSYKNS